MDGDYEELHQRNHIPWCQIYCGGLSLFIPKVCMLLFYFKMRCPFILSLSLLYHIVVYSLASHVHCILIFAGGNSSFIVSSGCRPHSSNMCILLCRTWIGPHKCYFDLLLELTGTPVRLKV